MPGLALATLGWAGSASDGEVPIAEMQVRGVRTLGARSVLQVSPLPAWAKGGRLVLARGVEPLAWFHPTGVGEPGEAFASQRALALPVETGKLQAWVIGRGLTAVLRQQWPVAAELRAYIDAVGPGAVSVWIDAGTNHGVAVGDCWWGRVNGQPVARYDVRLVGSDVCFCRVVSLAAGWSPARGEVVSLWPTPGQRRTGRFTSAVSLVETGGNGQMVWVAAPAKIEAPAEPRVDFYRDGRYVGSGVVERRDQRFWHVRTLPAAGVGEIRVGDDATIRTSADIRERRISARVFEQTPAGYLINAGEIDGLSVNDVGTVCRTGRQIARVRLTKVQRGYSVVQMTGYEEDAQATSSAPSGDALQRLDEVRFGPPQAPTATLGVIGRVVDDTLFAARITGASAPPLFVPLALRHADRTIGVAILLEVSDRRVLGFALARSLTRSLAAGDELMLSLKRAPPSTQPSSARSGDTSPGLFTAESAEN